MSEPVAKRRPMIDLEEFERRLRQPASPARTDGDPLAELARLGGGQEDPYKNMFQPLSESAPAPQEEWLPSFPAQASPHDHHGRAFGGDFAAIEAGLRSSLPPDALHAADEHLDANFFAGEQETGHWHDEHDDHFSQSEFPGEETRPRWPFYIMAAIIAVGLTGIGVSFAFKNSSSGSHEIATIKAAGGPTKIQPETERESDVPSQAASILDKAPQPAKVALVDHAEQPVDLSQAQERQPRVVPLSGAGAASVPVPPPPPAQSQGQALSSQTQASAQTEPLSIASLIEPKKVKTVSVRPDGTLLPNDTPPPVQSSVAPLPVPRPPVASAATPKPATPKSTARVATTPREPAPIDATNQPMQLGGAAKPAAAAKPVQVAEAQTGAPDAAGGAGAYSVQLAAPPSEEEARAAQVKLLKQYSGVLSSYHTSIRKAVAGDKTVYRVRVGGLSHDEATGLCQKLQSSGGNCFVAKN